MSAIQTEGTALWTTPTLGLVVLFFSTVLFIKSLMTRYPVNIPPFPVKPYPVVGHLPYLRKDMRQQIRDWTKAVGAIFSLRLGPNHFVFLNNYKLAHQAFVKNGEKFSDRPPDMSIVDEFADTGIINSSGHTWKEQRTVSLQILRSFGMGKNILAHKVGEEVEAYLDELRKFGGEAKDVRSLTNMAVSNVICSIIVGRRFQFDDDYFIKFIDMMNDQVRLLSTQNASNTFKWLQYLPFDIFGRKRLVSNFYDIHNFFAEHHIKKVESNFNENEIDNFISAYFVEMKKMATSGTDTTLDRKNLARVIQNLFIAGSETTSTTMLWFMLYMLHYPEVQARVFAEIKDVVGTERSPSMQDRVKLNYTNATILETQRLGSIVPFGLPHYCKLDTNLGDYTIPAGSTVMVNFDAILLSEETWTDPLAFRPDRFLDDAGKLNQPEQLVPFSLGRRVCLGEALAKMELFLFLTCLVQRFELRAATTGELPAREAADGVTSPPLPFEVRFIDRVDS